MFILSTVVGGFAGLAAGYLILCHFDLRYDFLHLIPAVLNDSPNHLQDVVAAASDSLRTVWRLDRSVLERRILKMGSSVRMVRNSTCQNRKTRMPGAFRNAISSLQ